VNLQNMLQAGIPRAGVVHGETHAAYA
jgi:hypothetical protein